MVTESSLKLSAVQLCRKYNTCLDEYGHRGRLPNITEGTTWSLLAFSTMWVDSRKVRERLRGRGRGCISSLRKPEVRWTDIRANPKKIQPPRSPFHRMLNLCMWMCECMHMYAYLYLECSNICMYTCMDYVDICILKWVYTIHVCIWVYMYVDAACMNVFINVGILFQRKTSI